MLSEKSHHLWSRKASVNTQYNTSDNHVHNPSYTKISWVGASWSGKLFHNFQAGFQLANDTRHNGCLRHPFGDQCMPHTQITATFNTVPTPLTSFRSTACRRCTRCMRHSHVNVAKTGNIFHPVHILKLAVETEPRGSVNTTLAVLVVIPMIRS